MKKILAITVAAILMVSVFAACGSSSSSNAGKEVTLRWMVTGSNVIDDKDVMDEINKYLKEKINAKLEMVWCGWGDFDEKVTMSINGGDDIDIYFTSFWTANEYVNSARKGAFVRLDDPENNLLEQFAPNYFTNLPDGVKDGMFTDGIKGEGIYAVPATKELAMQYVWEMKKEMFDKYELSYDDFNDIYDLGPLLEKVKAGEGAKFYPIAADYPVLERMSLPMEIVDNEELIAFHFDPVNPSKSDTVLKSHFEMPEYKKFVEQMHEYYKAGYVNPGASVEQTMNQVWTDAKTSGDFLVSVRVAAPGYNLSESATFGYTEDIKNAVAGILSTNGPRGGMHAISTVSKNPDRAMMLLDLVNSDVKLHDMLAYGLEGTHYTLENGKVAPTDKATDYTVWKAGLGQLAMYTPTVNEPDNIKQLIEDFNKVETSPLMGWTFDPEPVKTEISALYNIQKEYHLALISGASDPAVKLPEFIDKLKANGIDKVIDEANRQVQEFLANS